MNWPPHRTFGSLPTPRMTARDGSPPPRNKCEVGCSRRRHTHVPRKDSSSSRQLLPPQREPLRAPNSAPASSRPHG